LGDWEDCAINERRAGPLLKSSDWSASSQRRISGLSAQATSRLPIKGTTKCSRIARGFGCGSISGFAAEVKPKAGFGFGTSAASRYQQFISWYQSECGDQPPHLGHWVEVHWCRHAGHTPPVSNVFHICPQLQDQRSSFRGDQPHRGQRMRGPEGSRPFS